MSKVHTFLPKKLTSDIITQAFWPLNRACMRTGLNRELDECLDVILKDERAHRRMGARFTNGQAKYRLSVDDAARFWLLHTLEQIDIGPLTAEELSHYNDRWAAVAKFKFACKRVLDRRGATGNRNAYDNVDCGFDTFAWFHVYYMKSISTSVPPMYWDLMASEAKSHMSDAVLAIAPDSWLASAPYMGIDYARDIAVRD